MNKELEVRPVTRRELVEELEALVEQMSDPEKKYQMQVGLRGVEFDVDEERVLEMGIALPVSSIDEAEDCLQGKVLVPTQLVETDGTVHDVLAFDPRPVGFSGFMDCVTHSLVITDRGLFELGRYPAARLTQAGKAWQWFIRRRPLTAEQLEELKRADNSPGEVLDFANERLAAQPS
jgi:hypothetical protein